ncbi:MAG: hypothetical protein V2A62_01625 [Candidatus Woesearchaeota archaeon]
MFWREMKRKDFEHLEEIVKGYAETLAELTRKGRITEVGDLSKRPYAFFIGVRDPQNSRYCGFGCATLSLDGFKKINLFVPVGESNHCEDDGKEYNFSYTIWSHTIDNAIKTIDDQNKTWAPNIEFSVQYNYLHRVRFVGECDREWYESFPEIIGLGSVIEPYLKQVNRANELERKLRSIRAISIVERGE